MAAEVARGETLVFHGDAAFVTPGWLEPLLAALETGLDVGAATAAGDAEAALAVRAESFHRVLGYDLAFDPASQHDDLRLRLGRIGQATHAAEGTRIVRLDARGDAFDEANRIKFEARWADPTDDPTAGSHDTARHAPSAAAARTRTIALYSHYPLTPGGGERYLLSLAAALRDDYHATLYTPDRYSQARLATLSRALDLPSDHIAIRPWSERAESPDVFVCMSNEILPSVRAVGRRNLFLCQFPFPMSAETQAQQWGNLAGYDAMLVYSRFAAAHAAAAAEELRLTLPPCRVLSPPVPQISGEAAREPDGPFRILNVGRFSPDGHCKRQDAMIQVFAEIARRSPRPLELHLAGALGMAARDRAYFEALRAEAAGLPVHFHLNAGTAAIHALYRRSAVYWHMTGADDDVRTAPERFEHFGITIAEAMSAGVIPISLKYGGPAEIVTDGHDGYLVADRADLGRRTLALATAGPTLTHGLREAARRRAAAFAMEIFAAHLRAIIAGLSTPRA